jgi:4,5-dihydroxyphthalate decarboxylase
MILTVACGDHDRTRRLLDGSIGIEGHQLKLSTFPPEEMFRRALEGVEFDISELSVSLFMQRVGRNDCPYVGIPAFPSRAFRHSAIYVRADGDIQSPEDLRGRIVGVRSYLNTAALVVRGLLADEYGVRADEISWRVGDIEQVERQTIPISQLLRPFDIQAAPHGATLTGMLAANEIDAIVHYSPPSEFNRIPSSIRRLFADPAAAERDYFRSTGIFPIMHLVGVRRTALQANPSLARLAYDAFVQAKDAAGIASSGPVSWPYGIENNRSALTSLTRYAFEQGVTDRQLSFEELFAADLLNT